LTLHIVVAAAGCSVQPVARSSWQLPVAPAKETTAQEMPHARQAALQEYEL
jgi:hypothetical protein